VFAARNREAQRARPIRPRSDEHHRNHRSEQYRSTMGPKAARKHGRRSRRLSKKSWRKTVRKAVISRRLGVFRFRRVRAETFLQRLRAALFEDALRVPSARTRRADDDTRSPGAATSCMKRGGVSRKTNAAATAFKGQRSREDANGMDVEPMGGNRGWISRSCKSCPRQRHP